MVGAGLIHPLLLSCPLPAQFPLQILGGPCPSLASVQKKKKEKSSDLHVSQPNSSPPYPLPLPLIPPTPPPQIPSFPPSLPSSLSSPRSPQTPPPIPLPETRLWLRLRSNGSRLRRRLPGDPRRLRRRPAAAEEQGELHRGAELFRRLEGSQRGGFARGGRLRRPVVCEDRELSPVAGQVEERRRWGAVFDLQRGGGDFQDRGDHERAHPRRGGGRVRPPQDRSCGGRG